MVLGREVILGYFSPFIQGSIWLKEKEGKEEEKFKKSKFGISLCVWNFGMKLMFGNTCRSWVRKTLTLQYMYILVGLS